VAAAVRAQGREKINLIYTFTKMGHAILVSDVDTVWMRNPLPYMARYPEADCLTSSDHLVSRRVYLLGRMWLVQYSCCCVTHDHNVRSVSCARCCIAASFQ